MKRALVLPILASLACSPSYNEIAGTQVTFDPSANFESQAEFYNFPWPSDLRLTPTGEPDMVGFPNMASNSLTVGLLATVPYRKGFPSIAAGYFQFSAPVSTQTPDTVIPASKTSPILIVDVVSGTLYPSVAATLTADSYTPANLLAVAPPPGLILYPHQQYAYVVMRSLNDANGKALGVPLSFQEMKRSSSTSSSGPGDAAYNLYQPLWKTLEKLNISVADVAAATVFTTGDVVQDLADMTTALVAKYPVQIDPTTLQINMGSPDGGDEADGGDITGVAAENINPRLCELNGTIDMPQFQLGVQPFNTNGNFVIGSDGLPEVQGMMTIPITITLPKSTSPMPANGYPLMVYEHGSGGTSTEVVDRGKTLTPDGNPIPGRGPAFIVAQYGLAAASSALPLNPERLPGATDYEYLNPDNLPVFPFNFEEGVIEQRIYIESLKSLQIPASLLGECTGVTLPPGATAFSFDPTHLLMMGQSMGAMYTNMITATEPRIQAVVPTGAGGYWSDMILTTGLVPGQLLLQGLLGVDETLVYLHPVLQMLETAWEPADPVVFTPRVALRPLPGAPVRPIYEVVGTMDAYFSSDILDAMALGYGNQEAGQEIWPELQTSLALGGFEGMASYPVQQNRTSTDGTKYTGVVVEYANDGILSGHDVAFQLDAVKYQYGCFLDSFLTTGIATVYDPPAGYDADNTTPCPAPGG